MAKTRNIRKSIRINGELHQERFFTKKAADVWYADMQLKKERIEAGIPQAIDLSKITVEEQIRNVMARKLGRDAKGYTDVLWPRYRDYMIPIVGKKRLNFMTAEDWTTFLDHVQSNPPTDRKLKNLSDTTRDHIRAAISILYEDGIKIDKCCLFNPVKAIQRKNTEIEIGYVWETKEEGEKYLSAARKISPQFHLWATIAANWGNRESEILGLQWADVKRDKRYISVTKQFSKAENRIVHRLKEDRRGKKKKIKFVAINEPIENALDYAWANTPYQSSESFLVHRAESDRPMAHSKLFEKHRKACEMAEVKYMSPHKLRHYFASIFAMSGGDFGALQKILGHSSEKVTEKYRHFSPDYLKEQANVVSISAETGPDNVRQLSKKRKR